MSNPENYRRHLVNLCASLSDDGLEDLVLRLVLPSYPNAHTTRKGRDGGIDVLSDYSDQPDRAWQAKNYTSAGVSWVKCRASLKAAMKTSAPPRNYTFVFPRALKESERNYWRDDFLKKQRKLYPKLEELDYWDDLPTRLESRPDLVNILDDGVLAGYVRTVLGQTAAAGINPLASATDLVNDTASAADHAVKIGATDPNFVYSVSGGEIAEGDDLPDKTLRFKLSHEGQDALPRYSFRLRDGNQWQAIDARVRPRADPQQLDVWFSDDQAGHAARMTARICLARGQSVDLSGPSVGLSPGTVPDRFRELVDENGLIRDGTLTIGVSEPLSLVVRVLVPELGNVELVEAIPIYRIPPLEGDDFSWAGIFAGTALSLECVVDKQKTDQVRATLSVALALVGENPETALRGLGFARTIGRSKLILECAGLLPSGGAPTEQGAPISEESEAVWTIAARTAFVLSELNKRDGRLRKMPSAVNDRAEKLIELLERLLQTGVAELDFSTADEFDVSVPRAASTTDPPEKWMSFVAPLPTLLGEPSLEVEQTVEGAEPVELFLSDTGSVTLRCRRTGDARIVVRLAD